MTDIETNACSNQCRENIPWYLNGTLSRGECEALQAHMEICNVCREDVAVHEVMRRSALGLDVAPLLPKVSPSSILDRDKAAHVSSQRGASRTWWAMAAGVAGLGVALLVALYAGQGLEGTEPGFETATTPGAVASIDYVLQVRFASTVAPGERSRIAEELPGATRWSADESGVFEVHVHLPTPSLAALEAYEVRVGSIAGVESAEFTALQLPMK